jgi:endonuclease III
MSGKQERAAKVVELLGREYPEARTALAYRTPWELLVATILSAQCTDRRVNEVTPALFARWPQAEDLADAARADIEEAIRSTGFFRNKAKSLQEAARMLVADYGGQVPEDIEELVRLPGVGRKTAKVVLGEAFGIAAGVVVDTHVGRVARRLGLSREKDAEKVAADLEALIPRTGWIALSMRMILHGRRLCTARRPHCSDCFLEPLCPKVGVTTSQ